VNIFTDVKELKLSVNARLTIYPQYIC